METLEFTCDGAYPAYGPPLGRTRRLSGRKSSFGQFAQSCFFEPRLQMEFAKPAAEFHSYRSEGRGHPVQARRSRAVEPPTLDLTEFAVGDSRGRYAATLGYLCAFVRQVHEHPTVNDVKAYDRLPVGKAECGSVRKGLKTERPILPGRICFIRQWRFL